MRVTLEPQPRDFINRQPPETRIRLREALHGVERGEINPAMLEDDLEGFYKVRMDRYRFILQHVASAEGSFYRVVFCERRKVVYELFSQLLGLE